MTYDGKRFIKINFPTVSGLLRSTFQLTYNMLLLFKHYNIPYLQVYKNPKKFWSWYLATVTSTVYLDYEI